MRVERIVIEQKQSGSKIGISDRDTMIGNDEVFLEIATCNRMRQVVRLALGQLRS